MSRSFLQAVEKRRSKYVLNKDLPISDARIQEILESAIRNAPSAFNSQTSRVVLLQGEEHTALWDIVLEALRAVTKPERFSATSEKVKTFTDAHATILYFEEQKTIEELQAKFPTYAASFPGWSEQGAGILQYIVWTALADEGVGASLQHYNPLIDDAVKARWNLPQSWKLVAQMPFGTATDPDGAKTFLPIEERLTILG